MEAQAASRFYRVLLLDFGFQQSGGIDIVSNTFCTEYSHVLKKITKNVLLNA